MGDIGAELIREAVELKDKLEILLKDIQFTMRMVDDVCKKDIREMGVRKEMKLYGNRTKINIREIYKLDSKWNELVNRINNSAGKELMIGRILDVGEVSKLDKMMEMLNELDNIDGDGDKWKGGN